MIERLARQPGSVYLLLAVYFGVNAVLRLATPASLEIDEGEQLFFAQHLMLGYDTQPPFYNWLQYGMIQLLGNSVAALTLLKNFMLFLCYLLFGLTAQMVLRDRVLAVVATLGLITIPQIGYEAQRDLTHSVAMLFAACLFMHSLIAALRSPTALNYALTGVAIGIGVLSKYNFVLLPAAALLAVASDRDHRLRLLDPRIVLTAAIAGAIVLPHALWFFDHIKEATGLTMMKLNRGVGGDPGQRKGLLALAEAIVSVTLPTLAVFAFAYGRTLFRAWRAESRWTRLLGRILVAATLLVLVLVLAGAATYIRHRWLLPIFFLLPLYLSAKIEALGEAPAGAPRRFGFVVAAILIIVPALLFCRPFVQGFLGEYSKKNVPYGPAIVEILRSGGHHPSIVVAGDIQLAGNVRLNAPDTAVTTPGYGHLERPFAFDATHPVLIIWRTWTGQSVAELPGGIRQWLDARTASADGQVEIQSVAMPYHYGREGDVHHFNYAWIYPAAGS